jgi:rSAM/selenodomain-associated transferase 2
MAPRVSIIIPTLNEAEGIEALLRHLNESFPGAEIIVADGGSTDETAALASPLANVVGAERGRATQMNAGAKAATGEILWFLHSDCWPSERSVELITRSLEDERVVAGGFRWELAGSKWYYKTCTALAHLKNRRRRNIFGDMGIFVRRRVFEDLGGYKEIPILEEVEFNNRLRDAGEIALLDEPLPSSDRKLLREGPMLGFIKNDIVKIAYSLGFSPEFLRRFY